MRAKKHWILITIILLIVFESSVFADLLFCAVGYLGEFTHIDPNVGVVSPTRNDLPSQLQSLAWSPDGILYAGRQSELYTIDPMTGDCEHFLNISTDIRGMAFSPIGTLYVTSEWTTSFRLRTIDLQSGNHTDVGLLWGDGTKAQGLEFSPDGILYAIHPSENPRPWDEYCYWLYIIDLDDAQMHLIGEGCYSVSLSQSLAFAPDGTLYAIGEEGFAQLNPTNGTVVGEPINLSGCGECEFRGLAVVPEARIEVAVDIKPGSCPNPVNVKSKGVLPIAILGTDDYDVTTIDPTSIRLAGVEPIRSGFEDVAGPVSDSNDCNCITEGPDGFLDLTLKFKTQRIVEALGDVNDGDVRVLTLTGVLFDPMLFETPIEGADCILIRGRHKPINPADINKDGVVNAADFTIFAQNWLQSSIVDE